MHARQPAGDRSRRWPARLALAAAACAVLLPLVYAGLKSVLLVQLGAAALVVAVVGAWWVLAYSGLLRLVGTVLVVGAPAAVLVLYVSRGLLWVAVAAVLLLTAAVWAGRSALASDAPAPQEQGRPATRAARPFLIMNPRSGGGKVGRYRLVDKARALGAEVVVLDADRPQDVAALARRAVADGTDLLGVAGGDGTQALVAEVAAEHGVPFVVIPAGTRNHFAMDLGLDRDDPAAALAALSDGVEIRVDLGFAGDRIFVNNASFGAYAAVVQSPAYRDDKIRTTLQILPDLLTGHRGPRLRATADDMTLEGPQALLVSNNPYRRGDIAGLGLRERLDSGTLGVLGISIDSAAQAAQIVRGPNTPGLTWLTTRSIVIHADIDTIPAGIDGEALLLPAPVRCRIAPAALRVHLPRDRPGVPRPKPAMSWHRLWRLALSTRDRSPTEHEQDQAGADGDEQGGQDE